ncbi:MAG: endonuclease/exonuclease/phosphatase family protein [Acidimicrobiia bacterium]
MTHDGPHVLRRVSVGLVIVAAMVTAPVAFAPASSATARQSRAPDRPLRVATFNISHGAGLDGVVDLERIARVVEDTGADVVGLQEVDRHFHVRSNFVDQASWLARRLRMDVAFGANLDEDPLTPGAPRRQYGTAVLSRHHIYSSTNTLLPRPEGGEQRGLLEVRVAVRGVPVTVFSTHLQHDSQVERLAQVEAIRAHLVGVDDSVVILGDLNARPEAPEIVALTDDLVDAWAAAGTGPGYTFDASTPHARIDYVLSSDDVVTHMAAVVTTDASDHFPVVVDLALPGAEVGVGRP